MTGYVPLGFGYTLTKQLQAESTQLSALSTANTPPGGGQLFPVNSPIAAFRVHGPDSIIPTDVNTSDAGLLPDYSTNSAAPISSVGSSFMLNGSQVYGSYSSAELPGYSSIPSTVPAGGVYATSSESSPHTNIEQAIFPSLSNTYSLKESDSSSKLATWTPVSLQPTAGFYRYDPTLAVYGYGAGFDLASRRKNATRESTATLKAWLNEHRKNPYPTKGEKIMLAIITKMTLTQVSTWFANSRRRLKKENKMTWEPKGRVEEDDDAIASAEELKREPKERASGCISSPVSTAIGTRMLEQDVVGVDPRNAIGVSVFKKQANGMYQ